MCIDARRGRRDTVSSTRESGADGQKFDLLEAAEFVLSSQRRVNRVLKGFVASGNIPSSLIFAGPEGVGKSLGAVGFASWLVCGRGAERNAGHTACGKVASLEHPDLHLIYPVPYGDWEKSLAAAIESRREDFFDDTGLGWRVRSIGIDMVRHIIELTSKRPYEGRHNVVILFEAHTLTVEAQNAFLKLLEEPPSSALFILVTEFPDKLLPTILSRCQTVRFDYPQDEVTKRFLERFFSVDPEEAERLSVLTQGNIERAVQSIGGGLSKIAATSGRLLELAAGGDEAGILQAAEKTAFGCSRDEVREILDEMVVLVRFILRRGSLGLSGIERKVVAESMGEGTAKRLEAMGPAELVMRISKAKESIAANADVELTIAQLLLDLAGKWC